MKVYKFSKPVKLFICLGANWGTKERRALSDCQYFIKKRKAVLLVCFRDAYLDGEASKRDVPTHHFRLNKDYSKFSLNLWIELKRLFFAYKVDSVHMYGLNGLWTTSIFLRKYPLLSFFLTLTSDFSEYYKSIIDKFLLRRVDKFFSPTIQMCEHVIDHLRVKRQNVESVGFGVDFYQANHGPTRRGELVIGIFIGPQVKTENDLLPVLHFIHALNLKNNSIEVNDKIRFHFFYEKIWKKSQYFHLLKKEINQLKIEYLLDYVEIKQFSDCLGMFDLIIWPRSLESLTDYVVSSVIDGTPIVATRTPSTTEFLRGLPDVGETYHNENSQELRKKCEKILSDLERYKKTAQAVAKEIYQGQSSERYFKLIEKMYNETRYKRNRFYAQQTS